MAPVNNINQILSMNADGTRLKQLTRGSANAYSPSWSPDFRYIAFVRGGRITVMEAKGEPRARVFAVCPSWTGNGHDWSADGLSIVFCGSSVLGQGLWRVPVNPDTEEVGPPELLREGDCFSPSCSPDGTKIAFHCMGVVRVLDLASGEEISFGRYSVCPTWNPTGDKIAFGGVVCYTTTEGGTTTTECHYEICTANPDGTEWTPVTRLRSFCAYSAWSPDGTQLVFHSGFSGSRSLYITTIGSDTVTLLYEEGGAFPNWAP
jgi:Tol biopolymer transport system component